MMSVVGTLHTSSPVGNFYKQVLYGRLCKEMHTSGASHVMLANVLGLDGSFMVRNNRALCFGHLRSGELMPLDRFQELQSGGKEYIIVGVDYMTREAEAVPTSRITAKDVTRFVFNTICCRFGTPL